jgi:hypothetical protein
MYNLMRRIIRLIFICLYLCLFISCSDNIEPGDSQISIEHLYNKWYDSYEENSDFGEIYRPEGYKEFQASKYRRTYTFELNGKCKWLVLSPYDAHYETNSFWDYDQKQNVISIKSESGKEIRRLKILELKKDLLRIETQEITN